MKLIFKFSNFGGVHIALIIQNLMVKLTQNGVLEKRKELKTSNSLRNS